LPTRSTLSTCAAYVTNVAVGFLPPVSVGDNEVEPLLVMDDDTSRN
jgi:hypothetical protein